ncbi:anti-sigma factor family protein [Paenibacillus sp. MAH-36]|uniref:Anti-sigma-W factor RsiW n=1 Tax=Paenibacillus violae TaxID=3077234 RepID=A0ABU3RD58_9BACL|nr:zf-HC2 domain-containing protein [Paenibacillus sp. PFR10]MDU0202232.1 zf-HC2 domain-containing protein [Paenibacillus sp. PFR10]
MNCQEVMELMQRQLDGDLNSQEEDELHAHLAYCLDCVQVFERLQRLSGELAQLPKVVPPYSLVDAILPQLDEIDKGAAASITDKAAVFNAEVSHIEQGQRKKLPWTRRLGSQFSWKFASGVVAAGLIIGFFAFNMKHPVMDNADGLLPMAASNQEAGHQEAAAPDLKMNREVQNQMKGTGSPGATESPAPSDAVSGSAPAAGQKSPSAGSNVAEPQDTTNAPLEKPGTISPSTSVDSKDTTPTVPSTSEPARMKDSGTTGGNEQKSADQNQVSPNPAPVAPTKADNDQKAATIQPSPTPSPTPSAKKGIERDSGAGMFAMTVPVTDNFMKSATGALTAAVEDHHVVIRNSETLEIIFESKQVWKPEDQITLVEWSKDDKFFYQVQSGGTLHTIRVDVKLKTEVSP